MLFKSSPGCRCTKVYWGNALTTPPKPCSGRGRVGRGLGAVWLIISGCRSPHLLRLCVVQIPPSSVCWEA